MHLRQRLGGQSCSSMMLCTSVYSCQCIGVYNCVAPKLLINVAGIVSDMHSDEVGGHAKSKENLIKCLAPDHGLLPSIIYEDMHNFSVLLCFLISTNCYIGMHYSKFGLCYVNRRQPCFLFMHKLPVYTTLYV